MSAAWRIARSAAIRYRTTARAEMRDALKKVWGRAQHERPYAEWCIEQDADAGRVAALPQRERAVEKARLAIVIAEHADTFTAASHAAAATAQAHLAAVPPHA